MNILSRSSRPLILVLYSVVLICIGATAMLIFGLIFASGNRSSPRSFIFAPWRYTSTRPASAQHDTLGIAANIYVVSLPRRTDRRKHMETLRVALGLRWSYFDAIEPNEEIVNNILEQVWSLREKERINRNSTDTAVVAASGSAFFWPDNIDTLSSSKEALTPSGSGLWTPLSRNSLGTYTSREPLTCATENYIISPYTVDLPQHRILSPARVACWHSHLTLIRHIVDSPGVNDDITVVFEDDIDMEWDIQERLQSVWPLLPSGWDMVFLGHCWSNESYYPALEHFPDGKSNDLSLSRHILDPKFRLVPHTRLHPSRSPKCTHAYALSPRGARRLLLHLLYPPFAYSRALDQAFAWLVISNRLKSYSVVPSVVVQRKVGGSDIMSGNGSRWKDTLFRGVFGT